MSSHSRESRPLILLLALCFVTGLAGDVPTCGSSAVRPSEVRWNELYATCKGCVSNGAKGCPSDCCRLDLSATQFYICGGSGCCLRFIDTERSSTIIAYEPVDVNQISGSTCRTPVPVSDTSKCPKDVCALELKSDGLVTCTNGYLIPERGDSTGSSLCPGVPDQTPVAGSASKNTPSTTVAASTASTRKSTSEASQSYRTEASGSSGNNSDENPNVDDNIAGSKDDGNTRGNGVGDSSEKRVQSNPVACFPHDAVVTLSSGESRTMSTLAIGDEVIVGSQQKSSPVYMFTHRLEPKSMSYCGLSNCNATMGNHDTLHEFLRLETSSGNAVTLTPSHFLYVNNDLAPAVTARIGDFLIRGDGRLAQIVRISRVMEVGLYNPQTLHGDIVVNNILTSTYTSAVPPVVAHGTLLPLRFAYDVVGISVRYFENHFHSSFQNLFGEGTGRWINSF